MKRIVFLLVFCCGAMAHAQYDDSWVPPNVKWSEPSREFWKKWNKWMRMDGGAIGTAIRGLPTDEFLTVARQYMSVLKDDPHLRSVTIPYAAAARGHALHTAANPGLPFTFVQDRIRSEYSALDTWLAWAPFILKVRITDMDERAFFGGSTPPDTATLHQLRVSCDVIESFRGSFDQGDTLSFWYMREWEWEWRGFPHFENGSEYIVSLFYREEKYREKGDRPHAPITLSLKGSGWKGISGAFRCEGEVVNDPAEFFGQGPWVHITDVRKNLSDRISFWERSP